MVAIGFIAVGRSMVAPIVIVFVHPNAVHKDISVGFRFQYQAICPQI
jgi:hypothetical protein